MSEHSLLLDGVVVDERVQAGLADLGVEAWSIADDAVTPLATGRSDTQGGFNLRVPIDRWRAAEAGVARLELRVLDGEALVLAQINDFALDRRNSHSVRISVPERASPQAPAVAVRQESPVATDVDARMRAEFELLGECLREEHDGGAAALDGLSEEALVELSGAVEVEPERLSLLQRARSLERETAVPAEVFYALAREGRPFEPEDLLDVSRDELRATLGAAVEGGIVDATLLHEVDTHLARLDEHVLDRVLAPREPSLSAGLGEIIACADLPPDVLRAVLRRYQARSGDVAGFWEGLRDGGGEHEAVGEDVRLAIETAVSLGGLLGPDPALIREMLAQRRNGRWQQLEDLCELELDDWCDVLDALSPQPVEVLEGDDEPAYELEEALEATDPVALRAEAILDTLEEAFPGAFIRREFVRSESLDDGARRILQRAGRHDFPNASIRERASREPALLEGLAAQEAEQGLDTLEAVERLSRVTSRAREVLALHESGLDSAHAVAARSRRDFIDGHAESLGGREQASRVHAQAQQIAAQNTLAMVRLLQALQQTPFVINGGGVLARTGDPRALKDLADARALFGNTGLCACQECRSVYSPAAYFVDLLRRLDVGDAQANVRKKKGGTAPKAQAPQLASFKPLDVLLARRPDIADLSLSCENTLTPLPYIDLVIEVLEARITGRSAAHDTGRTPADVLKAVPQYIDRDAYEQLRRAVHPITLPFHEPLAVMRAYLGHLGVRRRELLETFRRGEGGEAGLLAESLDMSEEELGLVASAPEQPWLQFGFDAEQKEGRSYVGELSHAPRFLRATGIGFRELIDLVGMRFIAAGQALELVSPSPDCDPEQIRIDGLDAQRLSRMVRILRLRRRLGWSLPDLDRALFALGARDLDAATLGKLVEARDLARRLDRPIVELLALWSPLDTFGDDNQFDRLLRTRAVAWRLQDTDAFRLREDRLELAQTADSLDAIAPALLAAFRLTSEELARARAIHARVTGAAPRLDLAGVTGIHRVALLSRLLKLRIDELDHLLRLVPPEADPFRAADPGATRRFVDLVDEVQRSSFSPDQLLYLYEPGVAPRRDPGPTATEVQSALNTIRQALADAIAETTMPAEPTQEALRQKLGLWLDAALVDRAMQALDPRTTVSVEKRRAFIGRHLRELFPDPELAVQALLAPPPEASPRSEDTAPAANATPAPRETPKDRQWRANIARVLEQLLPVLRARQMRGAVVKGLSDSLGTSSAATMRLLEQVMKSRRSAGRPLLDDFFALAGTGLTGLYFAYAGLQGEAVFTRVDGRLEFSWSGAPPAPGLRGSGFGVRWKGRLLPRTKAQHTFFVSTDGAVRLSVKTGGSEQVLIDHPGGTGTIEEFVSNQVLLDPAELHEIVIEYRSKGPMPAFSLQLGTSPDSKQSIPGANLYPADGLASFEPVALSYRRLHKAAMLIKGFGIGDELLEWLSSGTGPLDLDRLPITPGEGVDAIASMRRWRQLAALQALQKKLQGAPADLVASFKAANLPDALALLAKATGWDPSVVETLVGGKCFAVDRAALAMPADAAQEPFFVRLSRAVDIQRRAGVSPETLFAWAANAPDVDLASAIVQAVKARYDEKRWLEVAESLNDPLRMERREALVSYLLPRLHEQGVTNRSQLFEFFLIDVEMNPCMLSSRIKQAISAVQTFYQRCLMNLERHVNPHAIDDADWQILKSYRVWEAQRKIFCYPEAYLEPELRDDKSPEFKVLERNILQQEITKDNVESAFIDYLQELDEISRLDVRAVWFEGRRSKGLQPRRTLVLRAPAPGAHWQDGTYHIFARTYNAPHKWFYRRLERGRTWTPWLKIDADIEGDHLVPVIFQNRMHLFWTLFRERNKPAPDPKKDAPPIKLGKDWEISLAYSVFDRGRWTRKQLSSGNVIDTMSLMFWAEFQQKLRQGDKAAQPRIEGSTWLPDSAYTLRAEPANDRNTLAIHLYRSAVDAVRASQITNPKPRHVLSPTNVELIARFELLGCNGLLAPTMLGASVPVHLEPRRNRKGQVIHRPTPQTVTLPPFTMQRGGRVPVPPGYGVDGNAYRVDAGSRQLLSMPTRSGGIAAVLQRPGALARGARVVPVDDTSSQLAGESFPFFFQDSLRSYFVRPVPVWIGPQDMVRPAATPLVRPQPLVPHFGRRRGSRSSAPARGPRRGGRESFELSEEDVLLEEVPGLESLERAAEREAHLESEDDRDEGADEAWHPDDAEAARPAPRRQRPKPTPAGRPPAKRAAAPPAAPSPTVLQKVTKVRVAPHWEQRLRFTPFEHPQTCRLINTLKSDGIEELLELRTSRPGEQVSSLQDHLWVNGRWQKATQTLFERHYAPGPGAIGPYPTVDIDFDHDNPYALYNWELFFHAPLQVAIRLSKDGRHEEAQRWFHFIFDPTSDKNSPAPRRYWRFAPFHENTDYDGARELMALLSYDGDKPELQARRERVREQMNAWWEKPFNPHVIARLRLSAYQKSVVMKYIDNLIEWGDKLFRRDTLETIQEATQLYILAGNILGPRPERVPAMVDPPPMTFRQVRGRLDEMANWAVKFENGQVRRPFRVNASPDVAGVSSILGMSTLYFCIPPSPDLDKRWDTVSDRLYKIRNCMNIAGVVRRLPLFEPPIDPSMLVRAAAAGVDLSSVIASLNAPPPIHRFRFLARRAAHLAEPLRSWGAATLSAIEKRDAEQLAMLRQTNEKTLLEATREAHKTRIKQVEEELSGLYVQRDYIDVQLQYVMAQAQQLMIPQEVAKQQSLTEAKVIAGVAEGVDLVAKVMHAIPEFQAGAAGGFSSPFTTVQLGGQMFGDIASAVAESMFKVMSKFETEADMAAAQAECQRRKIELMHEGDLLAKDRERIQKEIREVQLKLELTHAELKRQETAVEGAKRIADYMQSKYTNEELYGWLLGQLSSTFFQAYKLAFDMAKLAERALQFERGDSSLNFIEFSYWDSLKKGLLCGERLLVDLGRMEAAALENDRRALEVVRNVSLKDDAPLAFQQLLSTGRCTVDIDETLLDGDFPGHYFRRLKTVSMSVRGGDKLKQDANIHCTLTLLDNRIRVSANASGSYPQATEGDDARFLLNITPVQVVATSRPNGDPGVFDLRFDDDRYLPFEGAGAISSWRIEMHQADNAVDLSELSNVLVSLSYSARSGGAPLEAAARAFRESALAGGRLPETTRHRLSLRHDPQLQEAWKQLQAVPSGQSVEISLPITPANLSQRLLDFDVRIEGATLYAWSRSGLAEDALQVRLAPPRGEAVSVAGWNRPWPGAKALRASAEVKGAPGNWVLTVGAKGGKLSEMLGDLVVMLDLRAQKAKG